jgi:hypothetical protein
MHRDGNGEFRDQLLRWIETKLIRPAGGLHAYRKPSLIYAEPTYSLLYTGSTLTPPFTLYKPSHFEFDLGIRLLHQGRGRIHRWLSGQIGVEQSIFQHLSDKTVLAFRRHPRPIVANTSKSPIHRQHPMRRALTHPLPPSSTRYPFPPTSPACRSLLHFSKSGYYRHFEPLRMLELGRVSQRDR